MCFDYVSWLRNQRCKATGYQGTCSQMQYTTMCTFSSFICGGCPHGIRQYFLGSLVCHQEYSRIRSISQNCRNQSSIKPWTFGVKYVYNEELGQFCVFTIDFCFKLLNTWLHLVSESKFQMPHRLGLILKHKNQRRSQKIRIWRGCFVSPCDQSLKKWNV